MHKIDSTAQPCPNCGTLLEMVVPIAFKGYRGLQGERCSDCGCTNTPATLVPVEKETISFWENLGFKNPGKR